MPTPFSCWVLMKPQMTPSNETKPSSVRRLTLHGARILLFCFIILLMRLQHSNVFDANGAAGSFAAVELDRVRSLFPAVNEVAANAGSAEQIVLDADGEQLGRLLQTFPQSESLVGFSGPTNVLIAFGNDDRIVGIDVLSSRDTREHVNQVLRDSAFMNAFTGLSWDEAATLKKLDGVSGATLTSLTMQQSVMMRLSGDRPSLKFSDPITVDVVVEFFPAAVSVEQDALHSSFWHIYDSDGNKVGSVLRTSPVADNVIGYQGPTEAVLAFDLDGIVVGFALGDSYDNEPYVGYVRDDKYFSKLFNDLVLEELADVDNAGAKIEGVSGATMTSMAVADSLLLAAEDLQQRESGSTADKEGWIGAAGSDNSLMSELRWTWRDAGTALVIVAGLLIALTSLRGNRKLRIGFQCLLIVYLGLINGDMVSQAMIAGWAANAVPWANAGGLVMLTAAAFLVPMTSRRNAYCSHLCPHGAVQDLLKNRLPWQVRLPRRWNAILKCVPALLLLWCVIVVMAKLSCSLVGIEPFDAWVFRIAGVATIGVAVVGLIASLFVPMAYCRYGCPTGALLGFFRFNSRSDRWSRRDWFAVFLTAVALGLWVAR